MEQSLSFPDSGGKGTDSDHRKTGDVLPTPAACE